MNNCPVCGSQDVSVFLTRSRVPVHQNLPLETRELAQAVPRGELQMTACARCGFVFNRTFDASLVSYGPGYENTQTYSPAFESHVDALVAHLVDECGVRNARVVEVGCGKGHFLRKVVAYPGANNVGFGFDPSYDGPLDELDGRLNFAREFFDDRQRGVRADVVVCRHVIEHIADPMSLLASVREALCDSRNARVFFETPCVEWILENAVVWDFFYEHCSLFSRSSLTTAFESGGFAVESVKHVFGGQYLWLEAKVAASVPITMNPANTVEQSRAYARQEAALLDQWQSRLAHSRRQGPVAVWGAGAKGVTFVNLVDHDAALIDLVVDVNPHKQGKFIPGTGHAIVGPEALDTRQNHQVVLMNPNYRNEVQSMLQQCASRATLLDWDAA